MFPLKASLRIMVREADKRLDLNPEMNWQHRELVQNPKSRIVELCIKERHQRHHVKTTIGRKEKEIGDVRLTIRVSFIQPFVTKHLLHINGSFGRVWALPVAPKPKLELLEEIPKPPLNLLVRLQRLPGDGGPTIGSRHQRQLAPQLGVLRSGGARILKLLPGQLYGLQLSAP